MKDIFRSVCYFIAGRSVALIIAVVVFVIVGLFIELLSGGQYHLRGLQLLR